MIVPYSIYSPIQDAFRYIVSFRYAGNKYECPFCKGHFSAFLPAGLNLPVLKEKQVVGGVYRLNSTCPRCYSGDRERLIYLFLKENRQDIFSKKIKLLHVAPERNLSLYLKSCSNIEYISADLNSPLADIKMDIADIKQPNDTYDVVICSHVLEHIQDDAKAMRELFRVLKKGGFAILQVPISYSIEATFEDNSITNPKDREFIFGQSNHVRIYGKDYMQRLEIAGFSVMVHDYTENLKPQEVLKYGLLKDEKIFVCSKV